MSRAYKKILGFFCLVFVVSVTAIAAGVPPVHDASAAQSDVKVSVTIQGTNFAAQITKPADGERFFDNNPVEATIDYDNATAIYVYLTDPAGNRTLIHSDSGMAPSDTFDLPLSLSLYGDYLIEVDGEDLSFNPVAGDAVMFSYHAIIAEGNPDSSVRVWRGPVVCHMRLQVFDISDTTRSNVLIEYMPADLSVFPGYPTYVDIEIPGFSDLDGDREYTVVVTAYDCSNNELEQDDAVINGIINPPDTGSINILGVSIGRADYLITGLVGFSAVVIFAFFLIRRKKSQR